MLVTVSINAAKANQLQPRINLVVVLDSIMVQALPAYNRTLPPRNNCYDNDGYGSITRASISSRNTNPPAPIVGARYSSIKLMSNSRHMSGEDDV